MAIERIKAAAKTKKPGESIAFGFSLSELLDSGETLTGTPTVTPIAIGTADVDNLSIGSPSVNVAAFDNDEGKTVAVGEGVQVQISGGLAGEDFELSVLATTTKGNTRGGDGPLRIRGN